MEGAEIAQFYVLQKKMLSNINDLLNNSTNKH